jgi:hypothetical protein
MSQLPARQLILRQPSMPEVYFPVEMAYATVHKEREGGHVVGVEQRVVLGMSCRGRNDRF